MRRGVVFATRRAPAPADLACAAVVGVQTPSARVARATGTPSRALSSAWLKATVENHHVPKNLGSVAAMAIALPLMADGMVLLFAHTSIALFVRSIDFNAVVSLYRGCRWTTMVQSIQNP